jgi:hypothetical protein
VYLVLFNDTFSAVVVIYNGIIRIGVLRNEKDLKGNGRGLFWGKMPVIYLPETSEENYENKFNHTVCFWDEIQTFELKAKQEC